MENMTEILSQGERLRMFPVIGDTSKEGRSLSIFLSVMVAVYEYRASLFSDIQLKCNEKTKLEIFTEVVFKKSNGKNLRPDALIIVKNGQSEWKAIVEAKVGSSELNAEQVESYLELAKLNNIDAVITVSNQFSPFPSHYPISISASASKKMNLYHWSWSYLLVKAALILDRGEVSGFERQLILSELVRFMSHSSSGVQRFEQMPMAWSNVSNKIQSATPLSPREMEVEDVVGAWYQETQSLSMNLMRQTKTHVYVKLPKAHVADAFQRLRDDCSLLVKDKTLSAEFVVRGAASNIKLCADFVRRQLSFAMTLDAPMDRKSAKARLSWMLKQLSESDTSNLYIRIYWQRQSGYTQHSLKELIESQEKAYREGKNISAFEIVLIVDLGPKFSQRRSLLIELETHLPSFFDNVGGKLKAWRPAVRRENEAAPVEVLNQQENNCYSDGDASNFVRQVGFEFVEGADLPDEDMRVLLKLRDAIFAGVLSPIDSEDTARRLREFHLPEVLRIQAQGLSF